MGVAAGKVIETGTRGSPAGKYRPRGACPALSAPMATGDGLLVRLRPAGGALSPSQFRSLACAAEAHGNGLLEITARGSLQIRGLRPETIEPLTADINAAGIVVPNGPAIEMSPLHGIDPEEVGNAASMEAALRRNLAGLLSSPLIAPKLSIVVDGGGAFGLAALSADIRVVAIAPDQWFVAIAGDGVSARPVALGPMKEAVDAVAGILDRLIALGRYGRARDIDPVSLHDRVPAVDGVQPPRMPPPLAGLHQLSDGKTVLGVKLEFGQIKATDLVSFLDAAERCGATGIRLSPGRGFFLIGLSRDVMPEMLKVAVRDGLGTSPGEATDYIAACAGAGACASAFYETKALAWRIAAAAPALLDGSLTLHLSGCAKGCAHARPALTVVGSVEGYDLVLDGRAADVPDAQIAGDAIESAIEKLARSIEDNRQAGESAAACLTRLGAPGIAAALQQE
ncbi:precorrin-3B synthase [Rhizobium binxianense]